MSVQETERPEKRREAQAGGASLPGREATRQESGSAALEAQSLADFHPWRRFFARLVDYSLFAGVFSFLWLMLYGDRIPSWLFPKPEPISTFFAVFFKYLAITVTPVYVILWLPVEAACLSLFGATPGKWLFGIRVHRKDGGRLSGGHALRRAWSALMRGMAFGVPLLDLFAWVISYRRLKKTGAAAWDAGGACSVSYRPWGGFKRVAGALVIVPLALVGASWAFMVGNHLSDQYAAGKENILRMEAMEAHVNAQASALDAYIKVLEEDFSALNDEEKAALKELSFDHKRELLAALNRQDRITFLSSLNAVDRKLLASPEEKALLGEKDDGQAPNDRQASAGERPQDCSMALAEAGKYGFINDKGEWVIPPCFNGVSGGFAANGLAAVKMKGSLWGYIDTQGKWVIPPRFKNVRSFAAHGLATVTVDGLWGYIDAQGEWVISPKFIDTLDFSANGRAPYRVNMGGKWSYIDVRGEQVMLRSFDAVSGFSSNGLARIREDEQFGYIDEKGEIVISPRFSNAGDFSANGLAMARKEGKRGYINAKGEWVIPPRFDDAHDFSASGLAAVCERAEGDQEVFCTKFGYVDAKGEFVIPPRFDEALLFSNGLAPVKVNGKWGYINAQGEEVIPPRFNEDAIRSFAANGLAAVEVDGQWGYINAQGELVIPPRFGKAGDFFDGLAPVKATDKWAANDSGSKPRAAEPGEAPPSGNTVSATPETHTNSISTGSGERPPPTVGTDVEGAAYEDALNQFKDGKYKEAAEAFAAFVHNYPTSEMAPSAQFWLGNAWYAQNKYKEAIDAQLVLTVNWPNSQRAPDAMLSIANCQRDWGDAAAARRTLSSLIEKYPDSQAAAQAKQRLATR
jgi:tol-pal system protein YbgF